jgi:hypothetical protein
MPAELGDGLGDHPVDAGDIAAIGLDRQRAVGVRRHRLDGLLRGREVDIGRGHRRALGRHADGNRPADAVPRAGHQRDLVLKRRHRSSQIRPSLRGA